MVYAAEMVQVNLQVRLSKEMLDEIEQVSDLSRSEFVRSAIQEKLRKETDARLEQQWIVALKKNPEDKSETDAWHAAEDWD